MYLCNKYAQNVFGIEDNNETIIISKKKLSKVLITYEVYIYILEIHNFVGLIILD